MNAVLTVLEAIGRQGEVTRIAMEAQIALHQGDTPRTTVLSSDPDSLCKEGKHGEALAIAEKELANHLGVEPSVNALFIGPWVSHARSGGRPSVGRPAGPGDPRRTQ